MYLTTPPALFSLSFSTPFPQHSNRQPPLPNRDILDAPIPRPLPIDAVAVSLPDEFHLEPFPGQGLAVEEAAHLLSPSVKPRHNPAPRCWIILHEP